MALAVQPSCGEGVEVVAVVDPAKSVTNKKTYSPVGILLCFAQVDRFFFFSFIVNMLMHILGLSQG